MQGLSVTSGLTTLTFDDTELNPKDFIGFISIPKYLKALRWSQQISCFSIGSCMGPFYNIIGSGLTAQKDSLESLDLDIKRLDCSGKGHAFNPEANVEEMMPYYKENPENRTKDRHLIGSLKDFTVLKNLTIEISALCGNEKWGFAPQKLVDLLPRSLQTLTLRVQFRQPRPGVIVSADGGNVLLQLTNFVRSADTRMPNLRSIKLLVSSLGPGWRLKGENEWIFHELEAACVTARLNFQTEMPSFVNLGPYFQQINSTRNPGRDY
jgi:hypothetical protein